MPVALLVCTPALPCAQMSGSCLWPGLAARRSGHVISPGGDVWFVYLGLLVLQEIKTASGKWYLPPQVMPSLLCFISLSLRMFSSVDDTNQSVDN